MFSIDLMIYISVILSDNFNIGVLYIHDKTT